MSLASRGAEFFRFCIVGGLTFLVDYGLLFLLTSVLDVHYLWSSAWAFIVAVIVNYYLCVFFVFHQAARSFARQVVFVGSSLAGLGINQICMWLLVDKLALHYMLAKVVATGGLSRLVADNTELIDVVDPQLVLDGLRIIYERARR